MGTESDFSYSLLVLFLCFSSLFYSSLPLFALLLFTLFSVLFFTLYSSLSLAIFSSHSFFSARTLCLCCKQSLRTPRAATSPGSLSRTGKRQRASAKRRVFCSFFFLLLLSLLFLASPFVLCSLISFSLFFCLFPSLLSVCGVLFFTQSLHFSLFLLSVCCVVRFTYLPLFSSSWADLRKKYDGGFLISRLIAVPADYATEERAAEVEAFFQANPVPGTDRTVKQVRAAERER